MQRAGAVQLPPFIQAGKHSAVWQYCPINPGGHWHMLFALHHPLFKHLSSQLTVGSALEVNYSYESDRIID